MRRDRPHPLVVLLAVAALVVGCGGTASPSSSPAPTAPPTPAAPAPSPTAPLPTEGPATPAPAATPAPTLAPTSAPTPVATASATDPFIGRVAVALGELAVLSSTNDDVETYELGRLSRGTEVTVVGGPVMDESGTTWYKVAPVSFAGLGDPGQGWVRVVIDGGAPWLAVLAVAAEPAGVELVRADVERAKADPADAKTAASSITAFGLDLYRAVLADPELNLGSKNAVISPTSVALALAMARAGAKGATATEMDQALHTTGWEALGPGLNALDQALRSRSTVWGNPEYEAPKQLTLQIANAAFGQRGWTIERSFLDAIAAAFGAGLRLVDYIADSEAARAAINRWVSDGTAGRIPELLGAGDVDDLTRLVLVNAIYLKAEWEERFETAKPGTFTRLDGSRVTVPTMRTVGQVGMNDRVIPYAKGTGWQAAELRFQTDRAPLTMTLILPSDLAAFERSLTPRTLERITAALATQREQLGETDCEYVEDGCGTCYYPYDLRLFMPRFAVGTRASLVPVLESLGIDRAFHLETADFTGIHQPDSAGDGIYISKVIHQANMTVDEVGTEAAAATAVSMATGGGCSYEPRRTITLRLDRPFLFVLRDVDTGAVLFMGRVVDPSQAGE